MQELVSGGESQVRQFAAQDLRDDRVQSRAVVNEEHPDVALWCSRLLSVVWSVMAIVSSVDLFAL